MNTPRTFEWDDAKAAANLAKHRMALVVAREIFADPLALIEPTVREQDGEARQKIVGRVRGALLTSVFVMRGDVCRLISTRRSNRKEERIYHGDR